MITLHLLVDSADPMKIMLKLGVARKDGMILNAANVFQ